mmetsp:Transcript_11575/g.13329  ORF Transcript_11575/g.13329 Transcript_11575/m.13329 type:complete len:546 (+) Transcript_11575:111-1748(+)
MAATSTSHAAVSGAIPYVRGSYHLIPKKHTVGKRIAVQGYQEKNKTELSSRTFKAQRHFFEVPKAKIRSFPRLHNRKHFQFYNLESKMIWSAFDAPECLGILLHDETIRGSRDLYDAEWLQSAEHWLLEARYWRCIGISKPFFDKTTLRAHCWEENGAQTGTLRMSQAMRHAIMDLERAVRRKELGLDPNYIWDAWGPSGFIDGRRADYLPRFEQNPYVDPDGVEVSELDIAPFNTHDQIRERYWEFIAPSTGDVEGVFLSVGHGTLGLQDLGNATVQNLYTSLRSSSSDASTAAKPHLQHVSQDDLRTLMYLVADTSLVEQLGDVKSWDDVVRTLAPLREEHDTKVDAARMLFNTRDEVERVRRFYEEKCGFQDLMNTPDKQITGAAISYVRTLRELCDGSSVGGTWGKELALSLSDLERYKAIGAVAYRVYRSIEDLVLDKQRRAWATRFAGETNEEASLDYLLENFGRRTQPQKTVGSMGGEFDREQEPIGRQVQRRVLDSDTQNSSLAAVRKAKGRLFMRKKSAFSMLHEKQMQNAAHGVH